MLGADVAVAELQRLAERQLEDLLGPRRERRRAARCGPGHADRLLDLFAHGLERDPEGLEGLRRDALRLRGSGPSRMCSVPMKEWLSRRASSCASTNTLRARSVKRSNTLTASPCLSCFSVQCTCGLSRDRPQVRRSFGLSWGTGRTGISCGPLRPGSCRDSADRDLTFRISEPDRGPRPAPPARGTAAAGAPAHRLRRHRGRLPRRGHHPPDRRRWEAAAAPAGPGHGHRRAPATPPRTT